MAGAAPAGLEQRLWAAEAERAALQRELDGVHHIYGQVMAEFTATTERDRVADQLRGPGRRLCQWLARAVIVVVSCAVLCRAVVLCQSCKLGLWSSLVNMALCCSPYSSVLVRLHNSLTGFAHLCCVCASLCTTQGHETELWRFWERRTQFFRLLPCLTFIDF